MREWLSELLALIFPPRCAVCDGLLLPEEFSRGIHAACGKKLFPVGESYCMHCGKPLSSEEEFCRDCRARLARRGTKPASNIRQGRALFEYRGAARQMMYRFKYANRREYAAFLADTACERWGEWMRACGVEAVVPVPMYRAKKRRRGYNQAELFARAVAERMGLACLPQAVARVRDTQPQKKLNVEERKKNLQNAFQMTEFIVQYKKVLLVDDIYTTGSTAEAVAGQFRRAGAEVYVLTACIGRGL